MIETLEVKNFKSIKYLEPISCKRINVLIGEPNTGKSNILETVGIFSYACYSQHVPMKNFVRFERMSNLFYDENLDTPVTIRFDDKTLEITFSDGNFEGRYHKKEKQLLFLRGSYDGIGPSAVSDLSPLSPFKFYRFTVKEAFRRRESASLLPPSGDNLLAVLLAHKDLKSLASQIFSPFGLRLVFKPQEDRIEILKQYEDVFVSYPYSLTSDTLQRLVFYLAAIDSNKDSFLAFEEPESHAFPYYTKYLAEVIALDKNNNQYLISTHNPGFLLSILEKSPKEDVAVFITYFQDYQTKVKPLSEKQVEELIEIDVFFNIERFLEEK